VTLNVREYYRKPCGPSIITQQRKEGSDDGNPLSEKENPCHIETHLAAGMAIMIQEDDPPPAPKNAGKA